jgi:holin-like protein
VLKELLLILGITYLGNFLSPFSPIPLPGAVIGLVILFLLLLKKIILITDIEETTNSMLSHLSFIFLPAGVGLIDTLGEVSHIWIKLLFLIISTTLITLVTTGVTVQYIIRKKAEKEIL